MIYEVAVGDRVPRQLEHGIVQRRWLRAEIHGLAPLRFRRKQGAKWERFTLGIEPRSAYLLRAEARSVWEHSIPPVETLRYSVTFRTLKGSRDKSREPESPGRSGEG